jgi:serine/threonine protein phosphatase 1
MESRSFAIADIHGCTLTFQSLVEKVIGLTKSDKLYLLGDYIDRGNDSKGVLDYIIKLSESGFQVHALKGNHEEMLIRAYESKANLDLWLLNGGEKTLKSFNASTIDEIPPGYIHFIKSLPYYYMTDHFIMVHAGLNFGINNPMEDLESILWRRNFEVDLAKTNGRGVIHGHTPVSLLQIQKSIIDFDKKHTINLDNGCVYGLSDFYGHLCALQLDNLKIYWQANAEKKKPPL